MRQTIAFLLNNPIYNDSRVIKIIRTLSHTANIHLFYINGDPREDQKLFNESVKLFSFEHHQNFKIQFLRHSFFCYEFNFLIPKVLNTGIQYDFIWANDLPTLRPAYILSKKNKAKLIYDSHEIYTETINQFFPLKNSGIKQFIFQMIIRLMRNHGKKIENRLIPKTFVFITVNESLLAYFKEQTKVPNGIVVMNLPECNKSIESGDVMNYREVYHWNASDLIAIYQGELNEGRGLRLLIDAIGKCNSKIKLLVIGNGILKINLQKQVQNLNLNDRVKFLDLVPLKQLPSYTKGADVGVNFLEDLNLSKKLASPNKLFEYIHAGIPVICSNTIENKRILDKHAIGILIDNTVDSIASGFELLYNNKSTGQNNFSAEIEKAKKIYCWKNQIKSLVSIID